jgi:hypothetical protein
LSVQAVSNWSVRLGTWLAGSNEYLSNASDPAYVGGSVLLEEIGTWVNNLRPSKVRITHNYIGGLDLYLVDKHNNIIAQDVSLNSGEEINIHWGAYNLDYILLDAAGEVYRVRNIEFFMGEC